MNKEGWIKYTGYYRKIFYDVKCKSGTVYERCWPNASTFHWHKGKIITGEVVEFIRPSDKAERAIHYEEQSD